ncbi:hypothetical protein I4P13_16280 [Elizabethkingia meningoseptica]|uniref:hypothetical protein n=1 Tax=Elizabethkingia meningoseptica TaxID=238 RepID=UPI0018C2FA9D|nr:hypothetical protein [Elizabethkingia meningoseptica]MBG0515324.1 hypothetical protein [Elizabethkingia meningoseptica]
MANNCFEKQPHENIDNCSNEDVFSGVATKLYYIPTAFIETFTLPANTVKGFKERLTLAANSIVPATGKGWKSIDIMVDENELKAPLVGNKGNKKLTSQFDFYISGFKEEALGFVDAYKNTPTTYAIPDANGTLWIVGTKLLGGFIDTAEGTTGKKIDDNSGVPVTVKSNAKLYKYLGEITVTPDTPPTP